MKRKIVNGFLLMAFVVSSVGAFVACKDYDEEMYVDLQSQIANEVLLREALQRQVEELEATSTMLTNWRLALLQQLADMEDKHNADIEAVIALIEEAESRINAKLETKADSASVWKQLEIIEALARQALAEAQKGNCPCPEGLEERLATLEKLATEVLPEQFGQVAQNAAAALILAKEDSARIDAINKQIDDLDAIANDAYKMATANAEAIGKLDVTVGELQTSIGKLEDRIKAVEEELDKLKQDLQSMITSITVQAAESPVIGYANTPVGLNATILAVYYGVPKENWDFPATSATPYLNGSADFAKWTERNIEILGSLKKVDGYVSGEAGETLITKGGKEGNAGTLYVTVNPASVNFEGQTLKLKDSQDNDAPATLSPLKRSDRTLNFGYTRAAENGFYEAQATITDVAEAKMNIDYSAIKDEVKDLLKDRTFSNVLELGAILIKNSSNITPAYGVAASWTDQTEGKEHNLYSKYEVAATAVRPLSLAFLNDWKGVSTIPGLERLQDIVGRMIDKIKVDLNLPNVDDLDITIKDVTTDGIDFTKLKVKLTLCLEGDGVIKVVGKDNKIFTVTVEGGKVVKAVRDEDGKVFTLDANGNIAEADIKNDLIDGRYFLTCFYYFGNEMEEVIKDLADEFNGSLPDDLGTLLEEIKKLGNIDSSINNAKGNLKEQISDYLTRVNNRLTKWINRAPGLLHLTLVANENDKVGILSQSKLLPTKASGELKLIPTTYSLELVAPTYKKFVAVTDVFNADGTNADVAKAKAANANGTNMAKVIEGDTTCTLKGESGYIYEVTYTAVDYFGKVALRKYYVKF